MNHTKENSWTHAQLATLRAHAADMSFKDLARLLGKNENAVRIKAHRLLLHTNLSGKSRERVSFNYLHALISDNVNPLYFRPKMDFFAKVDISTKRFWAAMRGEINLTNNELLRIAQELNVDLAKYKERLQLELELD